MCLALGALSAMRSVSGKNMKIREIPGLVSISFFSLLYDVVLFIYQSFLFGGKIWWWRLNFYYGLEYFWGVHRIANREARAFARQKENFIYGETPCISIKGMLGGLALTPGDIFVDMGSGRGHAIFFAQLLFGLKSRGYELIPSFVYKAKLINCFLKINDVEFHQKDFLDADISDAKVIFIVATTFTPDLVAGLVEKLREAPCGALILSVSRSLEGDHLESQKEEPHLFSWGKSQVYFYKRMNREESSQDR
jgi:hypothetical protein